MDDINDLNKNGIVIDNNVNIFVILLCLSHDNLSANLMVGMCGSFSTNFCCRFCKADLKIIEQATKDDEKLIRKDFYLELDLFDPNEKSQKTYLQDTCGLKSKSSLYQVNDFSISTGSAVDILHDIYEGVVIFALRKAFECLAKSKIIEEEQIITRINRFNYGKLNRCHKPSNVKLTRQGNLGLSGMQAKTLAMFFPFIFGDLFNITANEKPFELVNSIIKIIIQVNKTVITEEDLINLEEDIKYHLKLVVEHFGGPIVKHHFLVHYPRVVRRLGE